MAALAGIATVTLAASTGSSAGGVGGAQATVPTTWIRLADLPTGTTTVPWVDPVSRTLHRGTRTVRLQVAGTVQSFWPVRGGYLVETQAGNRPQRLYLARSDGSARPVYRASRREYYAEITAVSPDGRRVAIEGDLHSRIISVRTGRVLHSLRTEGWFVALKGHRALLTKASGGAWWWYAGRLHRLTRATIDTADVAGHQVVLGDSPYAVAPLRRGTRPRWSVNPNTTYLVSRSFSPDHRWVVVASEAAQGEDGGAPQRLDVRGTARGHARFGYRAQAFVDTEIAWQGSSSLVAVVVEHDATTDSDFRLGLVRCTGTSCVRVSPIGQVTKPDGSDAFDILLPRGNDGS